MQINKNITRLDLSRIFLSNPVINYYNSFEKEA